VTPPLKDRGPDRTKNEEQKSAKRTDSKEGKKGEEIKAYSETINERKALLRICQDLVRLEGGKRNVDILWWEKKTPVPQRKREGGPLLSEMLEMFAKEKTYNAPSAPNEA